MSAAGMPRLSEPAMRFAELYDDFLNKSLEEIIDQIFHFVERPTIEWTTLLPYKGEGFELWKECIEESTMNRFDTVFDEAANTVTLVHLLDMTATPTVALADLEMVDQVNYSDQFSASSEDKATFTGAISSVGGLEGLQNEMCCAMLVASKYSAFSVRRPIFGRDMDESKWCLAPCQAGNMHSDDYPVPTIGQPSNGAISLRRKEKRAVYACTTSAGLPTRQGCFEDGVAPIFQDEDAESALFQSSYLLDFEQSGSFHI